MLCENYWLHNKKRKKKERKKQLGYMKNNSFVNMMRSHSQLITLIQVSKWARKYEKRLQVKWVNCIILLVSSFGIHL